MDQEDTDENSDTNPVPLGSFSRMSVIANPPQQLL